MGFPAIMYLSKSRVRDLWTKLSPRIKGQQATEILAEEEWPPWRADTIVNAIHGYAQQEELLGGIRQLLAVPDQSTFFWLRGRFYEKQLSSRQPRSEYGQLLVSENAIETEFAAEPEGVFRVTLAIENIAGIDWKEGRWHAWESGAIHMLRQLRGDGFRAEGLFTVEGPCQDNTTLLRAIFLRTVWRNGEWSEIPETIITSRGRSGCEMSLAPSAAELVVRRAKTEGGVRIFLSYRRADSELVVGPIYDRLIAHFPMGHVFRDLDSIPVGKPFPQVLDEAIANASVALIIIGPAWASVKDSNGVRRLDNPADFVRLEVEKALAGDFPVVPVLVNRATMPNESDLPESLRPLVIRHGLSVRPDPDFHRDMDRLIGKLCSLLEPDVSTKAHNTPLVDNVE